TIYPHGIDKLVARSGRLRGEEAIIRLDLPHERRETSLFVQIQPSLAVTMLDALPYLIEYPYGCTEQTMSRFLPAAIVARTLARNGLDPSDIEGRIFGGIERGSAAKTHPKGAKSLHLLDDITNASMARLYDFQHSDGGWGWWKDGDSDDFMTAYVVWGFAVAREGGLSVRDNALEAAIRYLDRRLVQHENDWEMQAWMLHAIGAWRAATANRNLAAEERRAIDNVWSHRERLTSYSRALLALALHDLGDATRAAVMVRNLEDGVKIDRAPDKSILVRGSGSGAAETMATARWGEQASWWRWHDGPVESTAFALEALVRIDPTNKLIEPAMN
ncbi:MAG: alpha-2-macroglobulin, partial [Thermoanaerobaculia bacterium]